MPRVFAYCRVFTFNQTDQTAERQGLEIKSAESSIETRRLIEENISTVRLFGPKR